MCHRDLGVFCRENDIAPLPQVNRSFIARLAPVWPADRKLTCYRRGVIQELRADGLRNGRLRTIKIDPCCKSLGTNVGYVNALLYSAKAEPTFHDITSGSNGDYSADKGWDACTGLGSPNGAALMIALRGR
jgi:hypothetical protein